MTRKTEIRGEAMSHFEQSCWELVGMLQLYGIEGRTLAQGSAFGEGYIQSAARYLAREGLTRLAKREE